MLKKTSTCILIRLKLTDLDIDFSILYCHFLRKKKNQWVNSERLEMFPVPCDSWNISSMNIRICPRLGYLTVLLDPIISKFRNSNFIPCFSKQ